MRSVLLIDDDAALLGQLERGVNDALRGSTPAFEVRTWRPTGADASGAASLREAFNSRVDAETVLVVADQDLTSAGCTGLFGSSIVTWCRSRFIPVGDFSRHAGALPSQPDLFEIRVPAELNEAAAFIACVCRGFARISALTAEQAGALDDRSAAGVLATMLGEPSAENDLALYWDRIGPTSGALMDAILRTTPLNVTPTAAVKALVFVYAGGHMLLNSVLRFPGPLASSAALRAYLATSDTDAEVVGLFRTAEYSGPFAELPGGPFFWLNKVDSVIETIRQRFSVDGQAETIGAMNRQIIEAQIGRPLGRHPCPRCNGENGGFYCPFTKRIVCQRDDCSVGSNAWLPQGARLCRIERDFSEEWGPILRL